MPPVGFWGPFPAQSHAAAAALEKPTGADKTKLPKDQQRTPPPNFPAIPVEIVKQ